MKPNWNYLNTNLTWKVARMITKWTWLEGTICKSQFSGGTDQKRFIIKFKFKHLQIMRITVFVALAPHWHFNILLKVWGKSNKSQETSDVLSSKTVCFRKLLILLKLLFRWAKGLLESKVLFCIHVFAVEDDDPDYLKTNQIYWSKCDLDFTLTSILMKSMAIRTPSLLTTLILRTGVFGGQ